ncbi:antibiotic biosynthesis monooxygenase [Ruegeria sediminis]|uniref:Antibiotic biosynthesis monooxygenase n=1 Tax=Ruegeria sediminis TaxID=2583820 RepID=A0ABY2X149_9RHOB|nr:antibiotic biosynthesis monooxygenase [Ruegeria sediminis]TMV08966.1 antibiotic biosynthesis monooxygenase [Ruegeria sediminis]
MTEDVYWILRLTIRDGQDAAFETLMGDMVAATLNESGARAYEWHRAGSEVHIFERYASAEDALIHLGNFGAHFADRFMAILKPTGQDVYGAVDEKLHKTLSALNAKFYDQVGGFSR